MHVYISMHFNSIAQQVEHQNKVFNAKWHKLVHLGSKLWFSRVPTSVVTVMQQPLRQESKQEQPYGSPRC